MNSERARSLNGFETLVYITDRYILDILNCGGSGIVACECSVVRRAYRPITSRNRGCCSPEFIMHFVPL